MRTRDDRVYLQDILESVALIEKFTGKKSLKEFKSDLLLQDAIIRRFEIIGEAASKVSQTMKKKNSGIEWVLMKNMRNKLIHEYFGVSPEAIYITIMQDLPELKQQIKKLLKEQK